VDSFNDFERLTLPELSGDRAARFLEVLLESRGLSLSAASRRRTLALVGTPIPYFIQVFVSEVANANAMGTRNIGPKRLEEIYQNRVLGAACKTCFQHYYDRLHHYDKPQEHAAKELLKVLALAHPQPVPREQLRALHRRCLGESATDAGFGQLIGDLENDFYTRYYPESGGYTFASKILCDWWRRYYAF
jgi:hypothetical protein